jgi:hypothetical protein
MEAGKDDRVRGSDEKALRSSRRNSSRDAEVVKLVLEGREQVAAATLGTSCSFVGVGLVWAEWKQMKYQYFKYMYFLIKATKVLGS